MAGAPGYFDGKDFFTVYDFVDAYHHFADPEWDGEPMEEESKRERKPPVAEPETPPFKPKEKRKKTKITLRDGKEREIQHMMSTSFWGADARPISAEEFLHNLFGTLPYFFKSEEELRKLWSNPMTRKTLLENLADAGYGKDDLAVLQKLVDAEKSDLFDVLDMFLLQLNQSPEKCGWPMLTATCLPYSTISRMLNYYRESQRQPVPSDHSMCPSRIFQLLSSGCVFDLQQVSPARG